jgi:23S rRNA (adenine2030-N6)-methyltransferase
MNYQHAYHAGNFADVHKHVVLSRILAHLCRKPAAFRVIDSHAGAGRYDLFAAEASRSAEWRDGIARVWEASGDARRGFAASPTGGLVAPYLGAVRALNPDGRLRVYPGSPLVSLQMLRPQDRLIACEAEPRAAALLSAALRGDRRAKALAIDGWTALGAYVPPKERRGLVLVDPPFEDPNESVRLSTAFAATYRKWPTGIYLLWYPIKTRALPDALAKRLQKLPIAKLLRCEMILGSLRADAGLIGSGLIIVNPPYTLEAELRVVLPALGRLFAAPARHRLDWLAADRDAHFSTD